MKRSFIRSKSRGVAIKALHNFTMQIIDIDGDVIVGGTSASSRETALLSMMKESGVERGIKALVYDGSIDMEYHDIQIINGRLQYSSINIFNHEED